mmetsp:Transcript_1912/g.2470  ORF Transcript_1912/g.2470 Transcript_1912/m.2470 type:complete len:226 (-) Transcript_1912:101-778(-)
MSSSSWRKYGPIRRCIGLSNIHKSPALGGLMKGKGGERCVLVLRVQIDEYVGIVREDGFERGRVAYLFAQRGGIDEADLIARVQQALLAASEQNGAVDQRAVARRVLQVHLHVQAVGVGAQQGEHLAVPVADHGVHPVAVRFAVVLPQRHDVALYGPTDDVLIERIARREICYPHKLRSLSALLPPSSLTRLTRQQTDFTSGRARAGSSAAGNQPAPRYRARIHR